MNAASTRSPILAMTLPLFQTVAGEGAALELRMRLLAGATPAIQEYATARNLEDIEDQIAKEFAADLSVQERGDLRACRRLRNKILHCDFAAARDILRDEIGVQPVSALAVMGDFNTRTAKFVRDTKTTAEGTVLGWYLDSANDFKTAVGVFQRCSAVVERLAWGRGQPPAEPTDAQG